MSTWSTSDDKPRDVDRPVAPVQVGFGRARTAAAGSRAIGRGAGFGNFEAHRRSELPLRQLALQRLAQVLDFLLVDPQVGVARHAELRVVDDVATGKSSCRWAWITDDSITKSLSPPLTSGGILMIRGSTRGALTIAIPVSRPNASCPDSWITKLRLLFDDLRKRMRGVEPDRRQQRPHFTLEVLRRPRVLGIGEFRAADQPDAGRPRAPAAPGR